jgi:hypothetical protein
MILLKIGGAVIGEKNLKLIQTLIPEPEFLSCQMLSRYPVLGILCVLSIFRLRRVGLCARCWLP